MISQSHPPQSFTDSSQLLLDNQNTDTIFRTAQLRQAMDANDYNEMPFNNLFLSPKANDGYDY